MKRSLLRTAVYQGIVALLLLILPGLLSAQKYYTAEKSYAVKLGRTKPLYEVVSMEPTDSTKLQERKKNKPKMVPNFAGRRHQEFNNPDALPRGADPLWQNTVRRMDENEILPILNFEGITESQANAGVPDVNGDVGRDFYVEVVNATHFRVYDKMGVPVSNLISANTIWSQVAQTSAGDPILLYDQEVDRWFLTEFPSNNRVLLAISLTSDPRGAWDAYAFTTPRFPDFPKYGIWRDAYYLTTNEGGSNYPIYAFNRQDILNGEEMVRFQRLTLPKIGGVFFEVCQPVDWDGMNAPPEGSPGLVVKLNDDDWGTTSQDHIILHKVSIDWENSANSNVEVIQIPTAPFDTDGCSVENTGGFSCVPQPNGQGIDGAEWIITNKAQYRNFGSHESFVMSFMVDVTGNEVAGIRWIEMRKTPSQDWHLYQEGTVGSDDGLHRFMSSIGIDGQGNIGLAYSISGFSKHASLRFTGRYATDPLGEMTFKEYEFASGGGSLGGDRFGDYASMSVDPTDDQTFWFAGEYVPTNGNWSTRIVTFAAARDSFDIFPISLITPKNSPDLGDNEPLTIDVLNRGLNTIYDFAVAYQFDGGPWITEDAVTDSLEVDSVYRHTFAQGLTFTNPGHYSLRVATTLDNDGNMLNDTLTFDINKYAHRDVAFNFNTPSTSTVCSPVSNNSINLVNLGVDTITSLSIMVSLNGEIVDTIEWTGEMIFNETEEFQFDVDGLVEGSNTFHLVLLEINGGLDELPNNNVLEWMLEAQPEGEGLFLNLLTDNFPEETTWQLLDANDNVIANGGPYNANQELFVTAFCLDKDACYTFAIFDSFGDGMSAQGVQGDYQIVNVEGEVIAELSQPNFGDDDFNQFCLAEQCLLELVVSATNNSGAGDNDGWALGQVSNGLGSIEYSIDGVLYHPNNLFSNLAPGEYVMYARDASGCTDTSAFTILNCELQTLITTLPATGGDVGEIHISATGASGSITYSLNGGEFVQDSFFTMLEPGDYIVTTRDSLGCSRIDTVTVSTSVSTVQLVDGQFIKIHPNPGKGVYQVEAILPTSAVMVKYTIFSNSGQPVVRGALGLYDDKHKGELSLKAFPSGTYYVVFEVEKGRIARRIIKIE